MTNDDAITIAIEAISLARAGDFVGLADRFAPQLRALVSAAGVEVAWNREIDRVGPVLSLGTPTAAEPVTGVVVVTVPIVCERGELGVAVSVHESDALTGLQ